MTQLFGRATVKVDDEKGMGVCFAAAEGLGVTSVGHGVTTTGKWWGFMVGTKCCKGAIWSDHGLMPCGIITKGQCSETGNITQPNTLCRKL